MRERQVFLSGEFVPESQAGFSLVDAGVVMGHMVFEFTRTFNHKPFRLMDHLERLYASMRFAEIDSGMTIDEMRDATLETLALNDSLYAPEEDIAISHNVSNGPMDRFGPPFGGRNGPTVSIHTWPVSKRYPDMARLYREGVKAVIPSQRSLPARLIDPKVKNRSRMFYAIAEAQARRVDPDAWALLTDEDGFITEGSGANFMIVHKGELISPEPRNILLGVTREVIVELATELGIPFRETNIGTYEAINADEAFFCSTPVVIAPVTSIEGHRIGREIPGPVTARLMEAFKDLAGLDFVAQAAGLARAGELTHSRAD